MPRSFELPMIKQLAIAALAALVLGTNCAAAQPRQDPRTALNLPSLFCSRSLCSDMQK
jgi:hypothetical protein